MQRAEDSCYRSTVESAQPTERLRPAEVVYKLRDLEGNVIDKKAARELTVEKFPSISQKRREEKARKNNEKSAKNKNKGTKNRNKRSDESRESTGSQQSFPDQPRQLPAPVQENSSMRSGRTLPARSVLDDMLSKLANQVELNSSRQEAEGLNELSDEQLGQDTAVDSLLIGGAKINKKRLDST